MTRLERKEAELEKLYQYRTAAMRNNDIMWMHENQRKIDALEKEIIEIRKYEPMRLSDALKEQGEDAKNEVYKRLLRISVLSDVVNAAVCDCLDELKKYGLIDFNFRVDVSEMQRLSQKIASVTLIPGNNILEDFIVNNDAVVDGCMEIADRYIKDKLKI